jgi:hypothetical protein
MEVRSRTITFTVNKKTADTFDAILNIPGKMMPDAKQNDDGWWSFTTQSGPARLKFKENKHLGLLDYQFVDKDATWDVPMRVIANGEDSAIITTLIKPANLTDESFDEKMKEVEMVMKNMKDILNQK